MAKDKLRPSNVNQLYLKASRGDRSALAKLLSHAENDIKATIQLLAKQKIPKDLIKVGVTGPPGAGKSTLINHLLKHYRKDKLKVAVLAIDPSSPFSGGAVLGDRIRMGEHYEDENIFIRSLGSRGARGGLSASAAVMVNLFGLCGYELVIIETVGVGQTELEIMNLADVTAVVVVPESGDVIQTLKAGILEIADVFVVNKADRPGADVMAQSLTALVEMESETKRPIYLTTATAGQGITELASGLLEKVKTQKKQKDLTKKKNQGLLKALLLAQYEKEIEKKLEKQKLENPFQAFLKI